MERQPDLPQKREFEANLRPMVSVAGFDWRQSLEQRMAHYQVPGVSVAVIDGGKIAWTGAYGKLNSAKAEKLSPGSLFQAASISKALIAAGLLSLVQDKKLDLDQDVNNYLTSWQLAANPLYPDEPVTLRRILSHTAGLTVHGFMGYPPRDELPNLVQILNGEPPANNEPLRIDIRPGSTYRYSGGGTVLATLIMNDVLDQPFAETMHERILAPMGLTDSFYAAVLPAGQCANAAAGHAAGEPLDGGYVATPELGPDGLWSTPTDIAKFALKPCQRLPGAGCPPTHSG